MTNEEKKKVPDAELIKGIKGGDTEFFEQLFQRYRFLTLKISRKYNVIDYDQDDIMQEARILFFQVIHEHQVEKGMSFGNLYKMKLQQFYFNLIRRQNAIKRKGNKFLGSLDEVRETSSSGNYLYAPQKDATPEALLLAREGEHRYYQLLSLYEKQVLLAHTKGYEIEEIATYYDKSIQSVKNALSRCRTKFND
ncbi:ECF-type sigma factor [Carnobacterium maltaromaticum]|uniref:ECF-type sigma factor n=1 Tax=Carnobacterium maltaromaticum TaxID=2751 RepID=UPI00298B5F2E|nr:ECF-type sigma factor [Carnobacterium maltaromaticum]MDW5524864.1 ECF-type sigma factor [Carnobacterium maltaromaticum]